MKVLCNIHEIDTKIDFVRVAFNNLFQCPVSYQLIRPRTCNAELQFVQEFKNDSKKIKLLKLYFAKFLVNTEFVEFKSFELKKNEDEPASYVLIEDLKKVDIDNFKDKFSEPPSSKLVIEQAKYQSFKTYRDISHACSDFEQNILLAWSKK